MSYKSVITLNSREIKTLQSIRSNNPQYKDINQILNICASNLSQNLSNRVFNSEINVYLDKYNKLTIYSKIKDDIDYFYKFIFTYLPNNGYKLSD